MIVVALFGGDAIAGEASWGNLRYLLMRPIGRGRLSWSKFVVAVFCAWVAVVLVVRRRLDRRVHRVRHRAGSTSR